MLMLPGNHLERLEKINTLEHKPENMFNTLQRQEHLGQCENICPGNCFPNTENYKQLSRILPDYTHNSDLVTA